MYQTAHHVVVVFSGRHFPPQELSAVFPEAGEAHIAIQMGPDLLNECTVGCFNGVRDPALYNKKWCRRYRNVSNVWMSHG